MTPRQGSGTDLQHATQRHEAILRRLRGDGQLRALEVARDLGVTHETVRKDLLHLEGRGLLRRVHGGALPVEPMSFEPAVTARTSEAAQKRRIAVAAATLVPTEGAILVDAGSTTAALVEQLPPTATLTVITNALPIALALLGRPRITVHTLGGRVRATTLAEVDHWALRSLSEVRVDVAFLGTNALSVEHGLSTPDASEAAVKAAMLRTAARTVLLADHTKLGRVSVFTYAEVGAIDVLVTDTGTTPKQAREIERLGVEVLRV
ncbi:DeoR/GlpR family DNA-binding transcription regulator [Dermatophilaceae bacterium Soc4.6]